MLRIYGCITNQHDLRLVALAGLICVIASYTTISLLHHTRLTDGRTRTTWLFYAAVSTGCGIWATHFMAMLAYQPGMPTGYDLWLTILSLVGAVLLTGIGFAVGVSAEGRDRWLGGAILGGAIAVMHYTGMAAFEVAGRMEWDPALVVTSLLFAGAFGSLALFAGLHSRRLAWKALGTLALTLAICGHHFMAMAATAIVPDPTMSVAASALPIKGLATGIAVVSFSIIGMTLSGLALDLRERKRAVSETERMRELAEVAAEGLVIWDAGRIASANARFVALLGGDAPATGLSFGSIFGQEARHRFFERQTGAFEAELTSRDGEQIPVELIQRSVTYAGRPHRACAVRDLRARKKAEQHIHYLAHHDTLTSLPNRNTLEERLDKEIEAHAGSGRSFAVLCLDLDRFKEINDLFGHPTGDTVLCGVADSVSSVLSNDQMAARLGGDEFVVIAPNLDTPGEVEELARKILLATNCDSASAAMPMKIGISIGVAVYPYDGVDRTTLLRNADTALYKAKAEGRGSYCFFKPVMGTQLRERRLIEHDLNSALARGEFSLVFQPQAKLETGEIFGFETLIRWSHPTRGTVSPAEFIPIAEENGLIAQLGEWVLREACREAASWKAPLTVAVNVSSVQLHAGSLSHLIHGILLETGLSPSRLELEVTETALIKNLNAALATLRQVKSLGIAIAIDDFGTGYSSLSNLLAFPFDKIKIDRTFVRNVDVNEQAAAIVRAIVSLGRSLDLPVLAEGVETDAEMRFLTAQDCSEVQGYLIGRPLPISNFRALVDGASAAAIPMDAALALERRNGRLSGADTWAARAHGNRLRAC